MKQERILCAAVWIDDDNYYTDQPIYPGYVISGYRHSSIGELLIKFDIDTSKATNGFLTSANRFVSRREGLKIAMDAKQVPIEDFGANDVLISEDLY